MNVGEICFAIYSRKLKAIPLKLKGVGTIGWVSLGPKVGVPFIMTVSVVFSMVLVDYYCDVQNLLVVDWLFCFGLVMETVWPSSVINP